MKAVLTGSTGFIGGEVLRQCIKNPEFDKLVVLSRRELPDTEAAKDPKVQVIIFKDPKEWTEWSDDTRQALAGAEICIYSLGKARGNVSREADFEWPLHIASNFSSEPLPSGRPFRFVYLSGALTEKDPSKSLWFLQEVRRNKGETEVALPKLAASRPTTLASIIVRPAYVYPVETGVMKAAALMISAYSIRVDELAAAMIRVALEEGTGGTGAVARSLENAALIQEGRRALGVTSVSWSGERKTTSS